MLSSILIDYCVINSIWIKIDPLCYSFSQFIFYRQTKMEAEINRIIEAIRDSSNDLIYSISMQYDGEHFTVHFEPGYCLDIKLSVSFDYFQVYFKINFYIEESRWTDKNEFINQRNNSSNYW